MIKFNVNDHVLVKLKRTAKILAKAEAKSISELFSRGVDREGYTTMQLYELFELHAVMYEGAFELPYETVILLSEDNVEYTGAHKMPVYTREQLEAMPFTELYELRKRKLAWLKSTEESRRELIDTMIVLQDVADLAELEALKQKGK